VTQRFLLLFHGRSGSTLLTMALAAHPAIVMYGELFHLLEKIRRDFQPQGQTPGPSDQTDYYRTGSDPIAFLQQQLYARTFPTERAAAGFKLSHVQMRAEETTWMRDVLGVDMGAQKTLPQAEEERFWSWLATDRDIRIILLHRRSMLETLVSALRAARTHQWELPVGATPAASAARFQVPVDKFRRFVDISTGHQEHSRALFAHHPLLELEYQQDIVNQYDATIGRIEDFLGVAPLPLPQRLQKQASKPLREEIANFEELQKAVAGTKYEAFL
jgi:LPS sulfotransferase NodH